MRIDYSEPKKSYVSTQSPGRPRRESGGRFMVFFLIGSLMFAGGFGSGWLLSQRSAKKAFKAAMEQQSLENSSRREPPPVSPPQPKAAPAAAAAPSTGTGAPAPGAPTTTAAPEPQLSFYKTLPSGQKSAVLGSGINARDDKGGKQPLQAAVPANLGQKPAAPAADPPKAAPPGGERPMPRQEGAGFTVQVASYSLKSEAEALRAKLAAKGYNVAVVESNQGDKGTWYRVRVGRKLEQEAAKELAAKLGKGALAIPDRE